MINTVSKIIFTSNAICIVYFVREWETLKGILPSISVSAFPFQSIAQIGHSEARVQWRNGRCGCLCLQVFCQWSGFAAHQGQRKLLKTGLSGKNFQEGEPSPTLGTHCSLQYAAGEGPDELDGQEELLEWGFAPEVGLRCEGVRVPWGGRIQMEVWFGCGSV